MANYLRLNDDATSRYRYCVFLYKSGNHSEAIAQGPAPMARRAIATSNCRTVRSRDLVRHSAPGEVRVSPQGDVVTWNGETLTLDPVRRVPLSRLHFW